MGLAKPQAVRILLGGKVGDPEFDQRVALVHEQFVMRMIEHYRTDPSVREVEGIGGLFLRLRRSGIKIGVDTGFSRDITEVILDRLGWTEAGLIDASATSDEVPRGRPHPDMIAKIMGELGIADPHNVAKVGDASADLQEGANVGCVLNIGVTWGSHRREELAGLPHTHLVDSVSELSELLLRAADRC
jgi:phosphonatase-like hydrolase